MPIPVESLSDSARGLFLPTNPTEFWTLVAGVGAVGTMAATVGLIVAALRGLGSLKLAQQDLRVAKAGIRLGARRQAIETSTALLKEMASKIIPGNAVLLKELAAHNIPVFVTDPAQVVFADAVEAARHQEAQAWIARLPPGVLSQSVGLLNQLEAWAFQFVHGLADWECAEGPAAPVYTALVVQMYPFLVVARQRKTTGRYPNVVHLFESWQKRQVMAKIVERAQELQQDEPPGPTLPPPIGTDLGDVE